MSAYVDPTPLNSEYPGLSYENPGTNSPQAKQRGGGGYEDPGTGMPGIVNRDEPLRVPLGELTALVEGTGEVVEVMPGTALSVVGLKAYVDAKANRDSLRLARDRRIKELEGEDDMLHEIVCQLAPLDIGIGAVESALAGAFDPNVRAAVNAPITVDAGFIRVTWPKPRETWTLAKPASYYGQPESKYGLMDRLRRHIDEDEQMTAVLDAVLDWLRPTRKLSVPSDPTITVRAEKGGA